MPSSCANSRAVRGSGLTLAKARSGWQTEKIVFGATVTIEDDSGEAKTYQIVGEDEIETQLGKISWKSPMAKALLGKLQGDEVKVRRPKGDAWVEIVKVEYI